jgi:hypothetical protein
MLNLLVHTVSTSLQKDNHKKNSNGYFSAISRSGLLKVNVKRSRNRPGVAHRVPGGLGSQIS